MTAYVARVWHDGTIRIYHDDQDRPAAVLVLPPTGDLRETLEEAGWRPTGRKPRAGRWDLIYVEPTLRSSI